MSLCDNLSEVVVVENSILVRDPRSLLPWLKCRSSPSFWHFGVEASGNAFNTRYIFLFQTGSQHYFGWNLLFLHTERRYG